MTAQPIRFVIFRAPGRQWYFRVVARNNRTIAQSEGYRSLQSCRKTVKLLRRAAGNPVRWTCEEGDQG